MVNVNSQQVTALLEMSLVNHCMVPVSNVDYSRQEEVLCVHADKHRYPKADVTVTINVSTCCLLGWYRACLLMLSKEWSCREDETLKNLIAKVTEGEKGK